MFNKTELDKQILISIISFLSNTTQYSSFIVEGFVPNIETHRYLSMRKSSILSFHSSKLVSLKFSISSVNVLIIFLQQDFHLCNPPLKPRLDKKNIVPNTYNLRWSGFHTIWKEVEVWNIVPTLINGRRMWRKYKGTIVENKYRKKQMIRSLVTD
jgi:hypothetical protein